VDYVDYVDYADRMPCWVMEEIDGPDERQTASGALLLSVSHMFFRRGWTEHMFDGYHL
jgi:hypothetical protein